MPPSVALIGAGRLGNALASRLHECGYRIQTVVSRNADHARALGKRINATPTTSLAAIRPDVRLMFCCVPDGVLPELAEKLAQVNLPWSECTVAHTSGALPAHALEPLGELGARLLSFHPLQTFTPASTPEAFAGITIALEGVPSALSLGRQVASDLGGKPVVLTADAKNRYHLAAVVASNFLVTLMESVNQILVGIEAPEPLELSIMKPLVTEALHNAFAQSPANALTGPIARGDWDTVQRHLQVLETAPAGLADMYRALGRQTIALAYDSDRLTQAEANAGLALLEDHPGSKA